MVDHDPSETPSPGHRFLNDRNGSIPARLQTDLAPGGDGDGQRPEKTIDLGVRVGDGHLGRRRIARHQYSGRRVEPDRVACSLGN
jgi:hypothetical protein